MRIIRWIPAALLAIPLATPSAGADPFDPKMVPADAKWVVSIDVDAARNTKSFAALCDEMLTNENVRGTLDQIKDFTGVSIPDDVDDVTVFGKAPGDDSGVIVLHGKLDPTKTVNSLQNADDFNSKKYRTYDVLSWTDTDKNQAMVAAFHGDSTVIIGHTDSAVDSALDAMDGKIPSLKADAVLAAGAKSTKLVYIAAKDISQLHGANDKPNPLSASVDSAWISLTEKGDVLTLHGELQAPSDDDAGNVRLLLAGVKGMIGVSASRENADPVAKAVAAADKSFTATAKDSAVMVDWPISIDQFKAIIKAVADKQAAKN